MQKNGRTGCWKYSKKIHFCKRQKLQLYRKIHDHPRSERSRYIDVQLHQTLFVILVKSLVEYYWHIKLSVQ